MVFKNVKNVKRACSFIRQVRVFCDVFSNLTWLQIPKFLNYKAKRAKGSPACRSEILKCDIISNSSGIPICIYNLYQKQEHFGVQTSSVFGERKITKSIFFLCVSWNILDGCDLK